MSAAESVLQSSQMDELSKKLIVLVQFSRAFSTVSMFDFYIFNCSWKLNMGIALKSLLVEIWVKLFRFPRELFCVVNSLNVKCEEKKINYWFLRSSVVSENYECTESTSHVPRVLVHRENSRQRCVSEMDVQTTLHIG